MSDREREDPAAAVTGAGGFIGSALGGRLEQRARVRGLFRRKGEAARAWRERGHEVVSGDLHDRDALARLVDGVDVVYHLAARKGRDDPAASRRVNVEGTGRVARAAAAAGVGRLVYVSSISVYAATEAPAGTIVEEVEPRNVELLSPYSATKYEGERTVRRLAERGESPPFTIVRPTNVYGPGGRAWVLDWIERIERLPLAMGRDLPVDLVHVRDVAEALVRAGESPTAAGETLHVGHETLPLADYVVGLGEAVGRRVWRLPGPLDLLVRAVVTGGHRLLHGDRMSTPLTRRVRFPHDKARRLIGYRPRITVDESLEELGRWYAEQRAVPLRPDDEPPGGR